MGEGVFLSEKALILVRGDSFLLVLGFTTSVKKDTRSPRQQFKRGQVHTHVHTDSPWGHLLFPLPLKLAFFVPAPPSPPPSPRGGFGRGNSSSEGRESENSSSLSSHASSVSFSYSSKVLLRGRAAPAESFWAGCM